MELLRIISNMEKTDATDTEIIEAAKAAHVHHFIKTLPKGYECTNR